MQVFMVSLRDYPPEAVFSTLEAARQWARDNGFSDSDVIGPYEVDKPGEPERNWWEAEDAG